MFALGIEYLTGYVAATDPTDRTRPEWPPHPGRILMALAAAWFESGRNDQEKLGLLWLEKLPPPALKVARAAPRSTVTCFVPVNDKAGPATSALQSAPSLTRLKQPRTFPRAHLEADTCFLCWPSSEPDLKTASALSSLCDKVTRIGHSSCLVRVWVEQEAPIAPNLEPTDSSGEIRLRIAGDGFLQYLTEQYGTEAVDEFDQLQGAVLLSSNSALRQKAAENLKEKFGNRTPRSQRPKLSVWQAYRTVGTKLPEIAGTIFAPEMLVLRFRPRESRYRQLGPQTTLEVTARVREAFLSVAAKLSTQIPVLISGHTPHGEPTDQPHLAILPLLFCDHENADGTIKGIGLAIPRNATDSDRALLASCLHQLEQNGLKLGPLGVWDLQKNSETLPALTLRSETWTAHPKGAHAWASVCPIALDRHPKAKNQMDYRAEMARIIADSCLRIGLPAPREVMVTPNSLHLGVPSSNEYPRLQRKDGSQRRQSHVILIFNEPVVGPIAVGAGRYLGYGLCRPFENLNNGPSH